MAERRWATIEEAAKYARCSRRTLDRRIKAGKLKAYRNGSNVLVDLAELDAMLSEEAA